MKDENLVMPFQVQRLIDGMNDRKETEHVRNNYRSTLEIIKRKLEDELLSFDLNKEVRPSRSKR